MRAFPSYCEYQLMSHNISVTAINEDMMRLRTLLCKHFCFRVNMCVCFWKSSRIRFYPVLLLEYYDSSALPCVYNSYIIHSLVEKMARVL